VGVDTDAAPTGCVIKTDIAGAGLEIFFGIAFEKERVIFSKL
jgi:hypothetical protein